MRVFSLHFSSLVETALLLSFFMPFHYTISEPFLQDVLLKKDDQFFHKNEGSKCLPRDTIFILIVWQYQTVRYGKSSSSNS